ncbi:endonuclease/exonuclease/phosphatase family protein [Patescibacteria group bacterium]|nr:endonuclease/exonuclease/phosphatase family protein [Patescibacteria group bacterium]MBU1015560.1 endonuclease/exonuclease/phosphatase family protein [Patescibacteria group bacterium]MBU1685611.1 endonuclease/exonuclease/phosphatase family protein [Patescibacteria group bacterium]MBU1938971.1 endonuclease/exonuclease/phosphatase family protein [Patescibacteria group bacterium]
MKVMFYNIAYGTGMNGSWRQYLTRSFRFFWLPLRAMKKMTEALKKEKPDVLCMAEVDNGSFRNRFRSQARQIARKLQLPYFKSVTKYRHHSIWQYMTMIRRQHDAILSNRKGEFRTHQLKSGMKKLVQEFVAEGISIFTVHLAVLSRRVRRRQLKELTGILKKCQRPHLVCGDFNIHKGLEEVDEFICLTGLRRVIDQPTFPSVSPTRHIDLFFASPDVKIVNAGVVHIDYSDHLPVWVEINQ